MMALLDHSVYQADTANLSYLRYCVQTHLITISLYANILKPLTARENFHQ